jgi:ubiquinone/menaquinone biosynthesis C-methylase UbiE
MTIRPSDRKPVTTSTGHLMSSASWIDLHYLACQVEYEAMISSAGLTVDSHVLDAGCGSGCFLPIMSNLVGQHGSITAIDLAPEHVEAVRRRANARQYSCTVDAHVGSITALPFSDGMFDAVWSANVFQYLEPSAIQTALIEFKRVLKPDGVVAIKDGDISALQIFPISPLQIWRLLDAWARKGDRQVFGLLESVRLREFVKAAGFLDATRRVTFVERTAPLRSLDAEFIGELLQFLLGLAETLDLAPYDLDYWRTAANPRSSSYVLNAPDLYFREAAVLITAKSEPLA